MIEGFDEFSNVFSINPNDVVFFDKNKIHDFRALTDKEKYRLDTIISVANDEGLTMNIDIVGCYISMVELMGPEYTPEDIEDIHNSSFKLVEEFITTERNVYNFN
jgi:phosphotransacetylase